MWQEVLVTAISVVPPTIAALAALRAASNARREVATNNGVRAGEYIQMLAADVLDLKVNMVTKRQFDDHVREDREFQQQILKERP